MYMDKTNINKSLVVKIGSIRIDVQSLSFSMLLIIPQLSYYLGIMNLNSIVSILHIVNYTLMALLLLNLLLDRKIIKYVLVAFFIFAIIVIEWLRYPSNRPALEEIAPTMLMQAIYFTVSNRASDSETVLNYLTKASYFVFVIAVIGTSLFPAIRDNRIIVSNAFFLCILVYLLYKNKTISHIILGIVSVLFLILFGRRAHVLYFALIISVIYLRKLYKDSVKNKLFSILAVTIFIFMLALFSDYIVSGLYSLLSIAGINSRTLLMMTQGDFYDLNGRDILYEYAFELMRKSPLLGNGIGSTMVLAHNRGRYASSTPYSGVNTHNGILEMGAEFGVIAMIIFVIIHVIVLVRIVKFQITETEEHILYILLGTGFWAVLIGASYLNVFQYAMFWGYYLMLRNKYDSDSKRIS